MRLCGSLRRPHCETARTVRQPHVDLTYRLFLTDFLISTSTPMYRTLGYPRRRRFIRIRGPFTPASSTRSVEALSHTFRFLSIESPELPPKGRYPATWQPQRFSSSNVPLSWANRCDVFLGMLKDASKEGKHTCKWSLPAVLAWISG